MAAAKKEAMFVAQRIQSGMQHVTGLKPHEQDSYAKAVELLGEPMKRITVLLAEDHTLVREGIRMKRIWMWSVRRRTSDRLSI